METSASTDRGNTLVESLVAIALAGTIAVAVLSAFFTIADISGRVDANTRVHAVVTNAADQVTSTGYLACPEGTGSYENAAQVAALAIGWDASSVTIADFKYWDPTIGAEGGWSDACNPAAHLAPARALQLITIRAVSPDGSSTEQLDLVKSDILPEAPDANS